MITKSRINRAQIIGLLLPGLFVFGMFTVYPIIRLFWMSLCDMSFSSMLTQPFAGILNYREVFQDSTFWTVFVNSLVYTLITVPGQMAIGLFIAILLNGIKRFSVTFRVINYLPVVTSWVIASLVFRYIFNTEGLLNYFLWKILGITSRNIRWLDSRWSGLSVAMIRGIWKGIGWNMVIFLAALQQVPQDLYEAADIDGATKVRSFFLITLPMLTPVIFFNLIMQLIQGFMTFTQSYVITQGMPMDKTLFITVYIYRNSFTYYKMGYGCAIAWVLLIFMSVVTALLFKSSRSWVFYQAEGGD